MVGNKAIPPSGQTGSNIVFPRVNSCDLFLQSNHKAARVSQMNLGDLTDLWNKTPWCVHQANKKVKHVFNMHEFSLNRCHETACCKILMATYQFNQ